MYMYIYTLKQFRHKSDILHIYMWIYTHIYIYTSLSLEEGRTRKQTWLTDRQTNIHSQTEADRQEIHKQTERQTNREKWFKRIKTNRDERQQTENLHVLGQRGRQTT